LKQVTNLYNIMTWGLTLVVAAILVIMWLNLYSIHSSDSLDQIDRNNVVSKNVIDAAGLTALVIIVVGVLIRIRRKSIPILVQEIMREFKVYKIQSINGGKTSTNWNAVKTILKTGVYDILLLGKLGRCDDFQQWLSHFMIMWGFIGLAITTTLDSIVNFDAVPLPLLHPVRVLGNLSGIVFMAGLTLALTRRLFSKKIRLTTSFGDWVFLISMYGTGGTGFLVQWYADTGNYLGTAMSYIVHLIFIAVLLVSAPWTKFIHALWRPTWIIYSRLIIDRAR